MAIPTRTAAVADSLEFEHKYTSDVITWAPGHRLTYAQIEGALDKFERAAWTELSRTAPLHDAFNHGHG